jgi:hypothetical protein
LYAGSIPVGPLSCTCPCHRIPEQKQKLRLKLKQRGTMSEVTLQANGLVQIDANGVLTKWKIGDR